MQIPTFPMADSINGTKPCNMSLPQAHRVFVLQDGTSLRMMSSPPSKERFAKALRVQRISLMTLLLTAHEGQTRETNCNQTNHMDLKVISREFHFLVHSAIALQTVFFGHHHRMVGIGGYATSVHLILELRAIMQARCMDHRYAVLKTNYLVILGYLDEPTPFE